MMRKFLYPLFVLSSFGFSVPSLAQTHFSVTNLNTDNGLPQNTIKDFHFDNAGFLWIATEDGLVRYDGTLFKLFSTPEATTLNNRIASLNGTAEGRTFVTDINGRIAEIKDGNLQEVERGAQGPAPNVGHILGTQLPYSLFEKLNSNNFISRRHHVNLLGLVPMAAHQYVLEYTQGIELYSDTTLLYSLAYPSADRYRLFKAGSQLIAFNAAMGFYSLTAPEKKWVKLKNETGFHNLKDLEVVWDCQQATPYAVYKKKVFTLQSKGEQLRASLFIDSLVNTSRVTRVEYNSNWDVFVVGTETEGLFIYRKIFFKKMTFHDRDKPYYGQYPLTPNTVVTNNGDIIGTSPHGTVRSFVGAFNNYIITDAQNIYYARGDTVYRYNKQRAATKTLFINSGSQMFVLEYHNDTLWMINANGIFFHTRDSNYISLLFPPNQNNQPYALERIAAGKFIYGNCLGLFVYQPSIRKTDTLLWIPQKCVRTLWRHNNKIFIGTYGDGWKVWDGKKIINMPVDRNQYLLYSHCFIQDKNNFLWVPTNHGLFKFYLPDVDRYVDGRSQDLYFYHYGRSEGIENTEFNGGCYPCAVQLQNGYTSLPNLSGLIWFKPEETTHTLPVSSVFIDKLEVNGKEIKQGDRRLELPAHVRTFRIELSSPFFGSDNNNQTEYRTLGVDTTWRPLRRSNPVIRYTTLPAGSYRLQVRKPQGFGKPFLIKTIGFSVAVPWYATTIALACWLLLLILLIILIVRIRVASYRRRQKILEKLVEQKIAELKVVNKKLAQNIEMLEAHQQDLIKREADKSRLIRIMSHDLVGPLRFMKMVTFQVEKQQQHMDKAELLETMGDIHVTADSLLSLCTDLLNWISYEKGNVQLTYDYFDLQPLIEEKIALFRNLAEMKQIKLINKCPLFFFIENDKNIVKIIIHNLLSNAIKFTRAGTVEVLAGRINDHYFLSVTDTGKGMSPQQVDGLLLGSIITSTVDTENKIGHGLGFSIIKELIAATKGNITIQSIEGKGTTVSIAWPLKPWQTKVQYLSKGSISNRLNNN